LRDLERALVILALACCLLGVLVSSTLLIVLAVIFAGVAVVRSIATLKPRDTWPLKRRRHRDR
jgi:hypothetical protein